MMAMWAALGFDPSSIYWDVVWSPWYFPIFLIFHIFQNIKLLTLRWSGMCVQDYIVSSCTILTLTESKPSSLHYLPLSYQNFSSRQTWQVWQLECSVNFQTYWLKFHQNVIFSKLPLILSIISAISRTILITVICTN